MGKKFVGSFSTGKDSTLAIYKAIEMGYEPHKLIITYNTKAEKAWFHGVESEIIDMFSNSLKIPVELVKTDGDDYEEAFEEALKKCREEGCEVCVYGDIDIENHLKWGIERCENAGLEPVFPLWQRNREDVVREFIEQGFKTVITTINIKKMNPAYLGRILDIRLLEELRGEGIDVCGENGEYHTLVVDGPLFAYPLKLEFSEERAGDYARLTAKATGR